MMNDEVSTKRELISALADGQLRGKDFARAVNLVDEDADARATWHAYHVLGDVMRSGQSCEDTRDGDAAAFLARFRSRLQGEGAAAKSDQPQQVDESNLIASNLFSARTGEQNLSVSIRARDASFRWKLLAGVASLAAVAAVSWSVVGNNTSPVAGPQLAQVSNPQPEPPQVMIRDPHLDALLAAHKQFGGTSALQMPAGFLRNATFEGPAR